MNAERALLDGMGLIAGIAVLVGLALAERQRLYAPKPAQPIPAAHPERCPRETAAQDVAWVDGKEVVVREYWRRTERHPCWYKNPELPFNP